MNQIREIKFRAWDNIREEMVTVDDYIDYGCFLTDIFTPDSDIFSVMQYTGMKDSEGQEIYEGDIVKVETLAIEHTNRRVNGIVKFIDGCYVVEFLVPIYDVEKEINRHSLYLKCFTINRAVKKIGNKFNDPELLE